MPAFSASSAHSLFRVGPRHFGAAELLAWAHLTGQWAHYRDAALDRLACAAALAVGVVEPPRGAVDRAVTAFRRSRRLLAATELRAWLSEHGLETEDLLAFHHRETARVGGGLEPIRDRFGLDPTDPAALADLAGALSADLVLSGTLDTWLSEFAARAASGVEENPAPFPGPADWQPMAAALGLSPDDLAAAWECAAVVEATHTAAAALAGTPAALRRELADHALDWRRVRVRTATLVSASAAAEVLLCVRADGMSLAEAAALAGTAVAELDGVSADLPPAVARLVLSAAPGVLAGPVAADGGHVLVEVLDKREPTAEDPLVHRWAVEASERRMRERALARVVWLGPR